MSNLTPDEILRNAADFWDGRQTAAIKELKSYARQLLQARDVLRRYDDLYHGCGCCSTDQDMKEIASFVADLGACLPEHQGGDDA